MRTRAGKRKGISAEWKKILCTIPGYDPIATAGNCVFDEKAAKLALDFFPECLRHVKGSEAGKQFELRPWEKGIIANLFGWKRPDGTRRFREAFIYVARKNGKTCLAAGLVLLALFCDAEPGAEIYSAAADRDQASLVFDQARGMVMQEPELRSRATVYTKAIVLNDLSGSYKAISADAHTKHGYNVHFAVIDELHAQPNANLVDVLVTATGSRRQPLIVFITTADYQRDSICNTKYAQACRVRDGAIKDESFLPVIFEATPEDDWTKPETWRKANPNMGISVSFDYLARECKHAQETPTYENTFKRLHLNLRTEQDVRWLPFERWQECACKPDYEELRGQPCFAGIDLASTRDLTALVLYFPNTHFVLPFFWVPGENAELRERRDKVPYQTWARAGHITLTEGNVFDFGIVREKLRELATIYDIKELAFDRWGATQLMLEMQSDGLNVELCGQGFASMSAPSKEVERLVIGGTLRHPDNAVLNWCASNVAVEMDAAGNIKPSKKKSTERIDGMVALVMAVWSASRNAIGPCGSVYESRGLVVL